MQVREKVGNDIKTAMKAKDAVRLSTLRLILAEFQRKEKEKGIPVEDDTAYQILQSMVRKRKESIEQFRKGNREDLAEKEASEIPVIEGYLPAKMSEDEIKQEVKSAIKELGASTMKDMGRVMALLTKKLSGKAEGSVISRMVKGELA